MMENSSKKRRRVVESVSFGVLSPDDIVRQSVQTAVAGENLAAGTTIASATVPGQHGSLSDSRMGVLFG